MRTPDPASLSLSRKHEMSRSRVLTILRLASTLPIVTNGDKAVSSSILTISGPSDTLLRGDGAFCHKVAGQDSIDNDGLALQGVSLTSV